MIELGARPLTLEDMDRAAREPIEARLTPAARERITAGRRVVESAIREGRTVYGVNTGFGELKNQRIAPEDVRRLQVNLLRSHRAGVGPAAPRAAAAWRAPRRAGPARPRRRDGSAAGSPAAGARPPPECACP